MPSDSQRLSSLGRMECLPAGDNRQHCNIVDSTSDHPPKTSYLRSCRPHTGRPATPVMSSRDFHTVPRLLSCPPRWGQRHRERKRIGARIPPLGSAVQRPARVPPLRAAVVRGAYQEARARAPHGGVVDARVAAVADPEVQSVDRKQQRTGHRCAPRERAHHARDGAPDLDDRRRGRARVRGQMVDRARRIDGDRRRNWLACRGQDVAGRPEHARRKEDIRRRGGVFRVGQDGGGRENWRGTDEEHEDEP